MRIWLVLLAGIVAGCTLPSTQFENTVQSYEGMPQFVVMSHLGPPAFVEDDQSQRGLVWRRDKLVRYAGTPGHFIWITNAKGHRFPVFYPGTPPHTVRETCQLKLTMARADEASFWRVVGHGYSGTDCGLWLNRETMRGFFAP